MAGSGVINLPIGPPDKYGMIQYHPYGAYWAILPDPPTPIRKMSNTPAGKKRARTERRKYHEACMIEYRRMLGENMSNYNSRHHMYNTPRKMYKHDNGTECGIMSHAEQVSKRWKKRQEKAIKHRRNAYRRELITDWRNLSTLHYRDYIRFNGTGWSKQDRGPYRSGKIIKRKDERRSLMSPGTCRGMWSFELAEEWDVRLPLVREFAIKEIRCLDENSYILEWTGRTEAGEFLLVSMKRGELRIYLGEGLPTWTGDELAFRAIHQSMMNADLPDILKIAGIR